MNDTIHKQIIAELIDYICEQYDLNKDMFTGKKRTRLQQYVDTRHMIYKALYDTLGHPNGVLTLKDIGLWVNGCDHSTVIHGIEMASNRIHQAEYYQQRYEQILRRVEVLKILRGNTENIVAAHFLYEIDQYHEAVQTLHD